MPWKECSVTDERMQFVALRLACEPMAELCREFGISRKTGYKIFDHYQQCGIQGLSRHRFRAARVSLCRQLLAPLSGAAATETTAAFCENSLWRCPTCGAAMIILQRFTAA